MAAKKPAKDDKKEMAKKKGKKGKPKKGENPFAKGGKPY